MPNEPLFTAVDAYRLHLPANIFTKVKRVLETIKNNAHLGKSFISTQKDHDADQDFWSVGFRFESSHLREYEQAVHMLRLLGYTIHLSTIHLATPKFNEYTTIIRWDSERK